MMTISRGLAQALGLGILLAALSAPVRADDVESYRPRHRSPDELAPIAAGLLEPEGQVVPDRSSGLLLLRGPRASLQATVAALREIDVPLRSYQVETRLTDRASLRLQDIEIGAWEDAGGIRIGRAGPGSPGFGVVFRSIGTEGAREMRTLVTVLEGHTAEVWTGTIIPTQLTFERDRGRGKRQIDVTPVIELRTGVQVRPLAAGENHVDLEIAPVVEEPDAGGIRQIALATRVRVPLGDGVVIASQEGTREHTITTPITSSSYGQGADDTWVWVRVRRAGSDPRP